MKFDNVQQLIDALRKAAEKHHEYVVRYNIKQDDWPTWYAHYMWGDVPEWTVDKR